MAPRKNRNPTATEVLVDLALQGGGSHGAFTWGVLDRLLEEPWLRIDGISGTSAGAMNGAVLVAGFTAGGPEGAKAALDAFWKRVSHSARFSPLRAKPVWIFCWADGHWIRHHSTWPLTWRAVSSRLTILASKAPIPCATFSPNVSTLFRSRSAPIRLFVTATNVRTGRGRVFRNAEITPDVLRLCLLADGVPGDRNRRRGLLGWRLHR